MKKILVLNKKDGETPLFALEVFRKKNRKYKDIKMTYAGRLDPMASGALLVLAGEEVKNKEKYLKLDKEYDFEILFGFATDTYDILGKVVSPRDALGILKKKFLENLVKDNLKYFTGKFMQKYPLYSSKTVDGKQLFSYGRGGLSVKLPEHEVNIKELKFLKLKIINNQKLLANIKKRIKKVKGDFRQKEILKIWDKYLSIKNTRHFFIGSFKIKSSSGTYVRGIANSLGERLDVPALAFSIKRTKVGKWTL